MGTGCRIDDVVGVINLQVGESLGTDTLSYHLRDGKQQAFTYLSLKFILHEYDEQAVVAVVGEKFLRGIYNNSGWGNVNKYQYHDS